MNAAAMPSLSRSDDRPVSDAVLDCAIEWQLCVGAGAGADVDRAALADWLAQHPDHARAWRQLGEIDVALAPMRGRSARAVVLSKPRRHIARRMLGAAAMLLLCLTALHRVHPVDDLLADYRTATGEVRKLVLPDGSVIRLNTRSAVDLAFNADQRSIVLRDGEIQVETSHADPTEKRPFTVVTQHGSVRALGTRFVVRDMDDEGTRITVLQSAVIARPADCGPAPSDCDVGEMLREGETALMTPAKVSAPALAAPDSDAWRDGMLVVEDRPLAEVVAEIARHRSGYVSVDPRVAHLRVTGTLSLADNDRALLSLTAAVPVELVYRTALWVQVRPLEKN